jgi:hypothetical protein
MIMLPLAVVALNQIQLIIFIQKIMECILTHLFGMVIGFGQKIVFQF